VPAQAVLGAGAPSDEVLAVVGEHAGLHVGEQADLHPFLIELGGGKALRSVVDDRADDTSASIWSDLPGSRCPHLEAPFWAFGARPRREANAGLGLDPDRLEPVG
jgi:hypothetical protein